MGHFYFQIMTMFIILEFPEIRMWAESLRLLLEKYGRLYHGFLILEAVTQFIYVVHMSFLQVGAHVN